MFNNPLRKYQQGGQTPSKEQEQMMAAFIQWLPTKIPEFQKMEPEQIVQQLNQLSQTEEGKNYIQDLMAQFYEEYKSQSFRNGGKIHDFICKHAKGGRVDCGCGGTKIKFGAEGDKLPKQRSEDKTITIIGIGTPEQVIKGTYDYPSTNGEFEFGKYGKTANVWDNTGGFPKRYADEEWIRRHPIRQMIPFVRRKPAPEGFFENLGERVTNRFPEAKFEDGGTIKSMQDGGGFARAARYYQNHANEGIIRKLQNFLYSRGYDLGDAGIDGRFGQSTYNAIRQYQRDNGLVDDGMWGEDTNSVHRVLGAGDTTFNGSRSGAHMGIHTYGQNFVNTPYTNNTFSTTYGQINDVIEKAIQNPEWFWGDSEDAKNWRLFFEKGTPDGKGGTNYGAILEDIWRETPDDIKASINSKKLSQHLNSAIYNAGIREATNNAAPVVGATLALPVIAGETFAGALAAPLTTVGSLAGSYAGSRIGGNIGERVGRNSGEKVYDKNGNLYGRRNTHDISADVTGDLVATAGDKSREGRAAGSMIGTVVGGGLGSRFGNWLSGFFRNSATAAPAATDVEISRPSTSNSNVPQITSGPQPKLIGAHSESLQIPEHFDTNITVYNPNLPVVRTGSINNGSTAIQLRPNMSVSRPSYNQTISTIRSYRPDLSWVKNAKIIRNVEPNIDWGFPTLIGGAFGSKQ